MSCVVTIIIKIEISTLAAEVVLALLATVMSIGEREGERERERAVNSAVKMIFPVRTAGQPAPPPDWLDSYPSQSFSLHPASLPGRWELIILPSARNQSQLTVGNLTRSPESLGHWSAGCQEIILVSGGTKL